MRKFLVRYNGPGSSEYWPLDFLEDIRLVAFPDDVADKIENGTLDANDANPLLCVQLTSREENE